MDDTQLQRALLRAGMTWPVVEELMSRLGGGAVEPTPLALSRLLVTGAAWTAPDGLIRWNAGAVEFDNGPLLSLAADVDTQGWVKVGGNALVVGFVEAGLNGTAETGQEITELSITGDGDLEATSSAGQSTRSHSVAFSGYFTTNQHFRASIYTQVPDPSLVFARLSVLAVPVALAA